MRLNSFPDLLGFSLRNRTIGTLKARMDVVSREAVTGLQADVTKATQGRVGDAHLVLKAISDIDQNSRIGALSKTRLDMTTQAISGTREVMNGIGTRAIIALDGGNHVNLDTIASEAAANLNSVISTLNIKQGPRSLLSGVATNTPPFAGADELLADIRGIMASAGNGDDVNAALETYFESPTGGFQTRIYQGSDQSGAALPIGDNKTIDLTLTGNDKAIRDTVRSLAVIATAGEAFNIASENFKTVFSAAAGHAGSAETGLIQLEGGLGVFSETLEKAQARDNFERGALTTAYQNLVGRDQFEAAGELKQLEVALESSYIITSRISELSLSRYLR